MSDGYISGKRLIDLNGWSKVDLAKFIRESGITPYHPESGERFIDIEKLPTKTGIKTLKEAEAWVERNLPEFSRGPHRGIDKELKTILASMLEDKSIFIHVMSRPDDDGVPPEIDLNRFIGVESTYLPDGHILADYREPLPMETWLFSIDAIKELGLNIILDQPTDQQPLHPEAQLIEQYVNYLHQNRTILSPAAYRNIKALIYKSEGHESREIFRLINNDPSKQFDSGTVRRWCREACRHVSDKTKLPQLTWCADIKKRAAQHAVDTASSKKVP